MLPICHYVYMFTLQIERPFNVEITSFCRPWRCFAVMSLVRTRLKFENGSAKGSFPLGERWLSRASFGLFPFRLCLVKPRLFYRIIRSKEKPINSTISLLSWKNKIRDSLKIWSGWRAFHFLGVLTIIWCHQCYCIKLVNRPKLRLWWRVKERIVLFNIQALA